MFSGSVLETMSPGTGRGCPGILNSKLNLVS